MKQAVCYAEKLAYANAIGANADKGCMAKRHHATITKNKIKPHRRHAKKHDPHRYIIPEWQIGEMRENWKKRKSGNQQPKQRVVTNAGTNQIGKMK
jgi:hypothetical protein